MRIEGVVLQNNLAMKVKETVMVLKMVASMMAIEAVRVRLSVAQTTARSLVHISMRRMIDVRNLHCL